MCSKLYKSERPHASGRWQCWWNSSKRQMVWMTSYRLPSTRYENKNVTVKKPTVSSQIIFTGICGIIGNPIVTDTVDTLPQNWSVLYDLFDTYNANIVRLCSRVKCHLIQPDFGRNYFEWGWAFVNFYGMTKTFNILFKSA